jgi:hypothetical protein
MEGDVLAVRRIQVDSLGISDITAASGRCQCGLATEAGAVGAGSLCPAVLIIRSHLAVGDEGLTDRRAFRVVRLSWTEIAEFSVDRPGGLWGGFCVIATRPDGSTVDLLSTRAYSRIPPARHLDEVYRICWSLEEAAASRRHDDR